MAYSVSFGSRDASASSLSGHALQAGGALSSTATSRSSRQTSRSLQTLRAGSSSLSGETTLALNGKTRTISGMSDNQEVNAEQRLSTYSGSSSTSSTTLSRNTLRGEKEEIKKRYTGSCLKRGTAATTTYDYY
ncbi:hypothetical protein EYF80_007564 [Liparis tanakae]|uniref:Uncharacterized protein n=1 Tax=Liparis tanakae TaxID=230148 RepID=A0A4Z2IWD6_9TELE|nr:hypothetical protein EYF80_007564 [Liparis tanakae]